MGIRKVDEKVLKNLSQLRVIGGTPKKTAADFIGVSISVYNKYESGEIEIPYIFIEDLAYLFKIDLDMFFDRVPDGWSSSLKPGRSIKRRTFKALPYTLEKVDTSKLPKYDGSVSKIDFVVNVVSVATKMISIEQIMSPDNNKGSRRNDVSAARFICFYLLYVTVPDDTLTLEYITHYIGGRDHSSAMYGNKIIEERLSNDENFLRFFTSIENHVRKNLGLSS